MATLIETKELTPNRFGGARTLVVFTGVVNTAGQPETYSVTLDANGNHDVRVQRTNGTFAYLNNTAHHLRVTKAVRLAEAFIA